MYDCFKGSSIKIQMERSLKIILNFSQKRREKGEGDHRGNISRVFLTHTGIWLVTDLRKDN